MTSNQPDSEPAGSRLGSWLLLVAMALVVIIGLLLLANPSAG